MTAKELKKALSECPDDTVIAIVNYRGSISRGISFYENPISMVTDVDGSKKPHLFLYEDNRMVMMSGITPHREVEEEQKRQAKKRRRAERETKRKERKTRMFNLLKKLTIWNKSK